MGVTFHPFPFLKALSFKPKPAVNAGRSTAHATLETALINTAHLGVGDDDLFVSSFSTTGPADPDIVAVGNGFFDTVIEAYNHHRMLIIRPDDVWMAILTQFSFFVNANAEKLRGSFVNHKGQKRLHVDREQGHDAFDIAYISAKLKHLLHVNITDPSIREWITPNFSTTTPVDMTVSAIIMMATFKKYFSYSSGIDCGFPSVTLEGKKSDWQSIVRRIEKLKEYGQQTTAWYHLLRPILKRFVAAFDEPHDPENLDFWSKAVHEMGGSGRDIVTGWITAFCVFTDEGEWRGGERIFREMGTMKEPDEPEEEDEVADDDVPAPDPPRKKKFLSKIFCRARRDEKPEEHKGPDPEPVAALPKVDTAKKQVLPKFDVTIYPHISLGEVPSGCVGVPILIYEYSPMEPLALMAGLGAFRIRSSGDLEHSETGKRDSVQPMSGWWLYRGKDS